MKRRNIIIYFSIFILMFTFSCEDTFLDKKPLDEPTEAIYFKDPAQFQAFEADFYDHFDYNSRFWQASDLNVVLSDYIRGLTSAPDNDGTWGGTYSDIRSTNVLLEKAEEYDGNMDEINSYVGSAHFFRAWHYFSLLQYFGGVPIITKVLDVDSEELFGPRNTRYEVVDQILADLDQAIDKLPPEREIAGKVNRWAAKAFKARVLLYEATWEKYVGTTTDWEDGQMPSGKTDRINSYLDEAITLSKNIMDQGPYEIFNPSEFDNQGAAYGQTYYHMFILEDGLSNPAGLTKAANNEYIFKQNNDYNLDARGSFTAHIANGRLNPTRQLMDMYLCEDGLPPSKSDVFMGYDSIHHEFQNRSNRFKSWVKIPGNKYWGHGTGIAGGGADWNEGFPDDWEPYYPGLGEGQPSYENIKFYTCHPNREKREASFDWPFIRLAEVLLIYAEAKYEKNGEITDKELDQSINKLRERNGVADLTNALVNNNGLDMLEEIRRERKLELKDEGFYLNDLKRWDKAVEVLTKPILGPIVRGTEWEEQYDPDDFPHGLSAEEGAIILSPASNRNFSKKYYLHAIPLEQLQLNPELAQNPGWTGASSGS